MKTAAAHEYALHGFAQPALPLVLAAGSLIKPIRRVPKLGWLVADPELARQIHSDTEHFSIIGVGASGHWWGQMLGDWVFELFEGRPHVEFRAQVRDLFTPERSRVITERSVGPMLRQLTADLSAGKTVDMAQFSREFTGRTMAELVGLPVDDSPAAYEELFGLVEAMANLGKGNYDTTVVSKRNARKGRAIADRIAASVPAVYETADPSTTIGRSRELGLGPEITRRMAAFLVVAGTATLASTLGRMIALLHDSGAQHELIEDRSLIPDAVREALRVTSSMPVVGRGVVSDIELAGRRLRAGDRVKIMTWSINNAAGGYDLRLGKVHELRQLWFGGGRHICLGASLTHVELAAVLEAMTVPGRPWTITKRRYRTNVFVPLYQRLDIALT
ncbi:cytochrome P450 [Nocardia vinacea]|uniref:cytochrome P450 n=1 Tax=Nocardia vinacea TaxID=96468 RepID=UPI0033C85542